MDEENQSYLKKEVFVKICWDYQEETENHYGYSSVMGALEKLEKDKAAAGLDDEAKILTLLKRVASMMLSPKSINEPFRPIFQDFQQGKRSAIADDFNVEELEFFSQILDIINEPWLKSRLADLLWLCSEPKNVKHSRQAIDAYVSHKIDPETWRKDVENCWNRAVSLCLQIRDFERLAAIKLRLVVAFDKNYPGSLLPLWIAQVLSEHELDGDLLENISNKLSTLGKAVFSAGDYHLARFYFDFAGKKYQQSGDELGWLESLLGSADSFEKEADEKSTISQMVANSFYENAIQAYRKIPVKHRQTYKVEDKIKSLRTKITESGEKALGEFGVIKIPGIDISEMAKASIEHVQGKDDIVMSLLCFTGLFTGLDYQCSKEKAIESLKTSFLSSMFSATHLAPDGRVVARTPGANHGADENDPDNQAILHREIQQLFMIELKLVVKGQLLPALRQLSFEYRFTLPLLETLCFQSAFVPADREKLMAYALWLGFEHDFRNAIHLLSPQFEHCIRVKLKEAGAITSNVDQNGIENENGLSTLMELPEASSVFGENLAYEIRAVFTVPIGPNLRNEVAHGLLDDKSSVTINSVYAWWMILRLVIRSLTIIEEAD